MSKHTPGPWFIDGLDISPKCDDELSICAVQRVDVGGAKGWFHGDVTAANAYLIAASPYLLEDLIDAAAQLRTYEALHRAKGTEESTTKAEVNAALASRFEATIARARGEA